MEDNTAPTAVCQDVSVQLDVSGSATVSAEEVDNNSADNCGIQSLSLSQTSFDETNAGDNAVTLTVTDDSGNTSTCDATVTVTELPVPEAVCQDVTVQLDATGNASVTPEEVNDGSTAEAGIQSLSLDRTDFTCSDISSSPIQVTLTVTDNNDNTATCTAEVTVEDNTAPTAICQDVILELDENGNGILPAANVDNNSTDNCGIQSYSLSQTGFDCADIATNPHSVILTVTDNSNNSSTCTAEVTVEDNTAPTAVCQDVSVQLDVSGSATVSAEEVDNNSADNCGIQSLSLSQTSFDETNAGDNAVTLTVTDDSGNTSTCDATVTVTELPVPEAVCQDVTVQLDATGNASLTPEEVNDGSTAEAGIQSLSLDRTDFTCSDISSSPIQVTLTVTDNNDNTATCTAEVTVEDNTAPTAICQNVILELDENGNGILPAADVDDNSTDNCGIQSYSLSQTGFDCADIATNPHSVILTVTDNSNNTATCTAEVTVEDNIAPTAICQDVSVQLDVSGSATVSAEEVDNSSADNCGIQSLSLSQTNFDETNLSDNAVTLTVTDDSGNTSTCDATVTVTELPVPEAVCQDVTVQLDATGNASVTPEEVNDGSTAEAGIKSLSLDRTDFTCSDISSSPIQVTLTVTDNNDNFASCKANITVEDNIDPIASCQDATIELDKNGQGILSAANIDNGSSDNCGIQSFSLSRTNFGETDIGNNSVTLTVTDTNGNTSTCDATVAVTELPLPQALCKNAVVQLDESGEATISVAEVDNGSNAESGIKTMNLSRTNFTCADISFGTIPVILTVTDNNENIATCTSNITVVDNIAPEALCQDVTIQLDASGKGILSADEVNNGSTDNCGVKSLSISKTEFGCEDISSGPIEVILTVADSRNTSTCTANVTVIDNTIPTAVCKDVTLQLDESGNAVLLASDLDNGSADACGIASFNLSRTVFDCRDVATGPHPVILTVTDNNNNSNNCLAKIMVEDNIAPVANCKDITVELDEAGTGKINVADVNDGSSDACGIVSFELSQTDFSCDDIAENPVEVTLEVTDRNNNTSTCTSLVTVEDNTAPVAICRGMTLKLNESGNGTVSADDIDNGSSDDCGIQLRELSKTSFNETDIGENTVVLTVTDNNGNFSTCNATVVVFETVPSVAVCQDLVVQLDETGTTSITANEVDNGSASSAGIKTLELNQTDFTCAEVGFNSVTLTMTDNNNNVYTCKSTITVKDNVLPDAVCRDVIVQLDNTGNVSVTPEEIDNGSSDACGIASLQLSKTTFNESDIGENTVTLTVKDNNRKVSTCNAVITVSAIARPIAKCKDVTVQLDGAGNGTLTAEDVDNGSAGGAGIQALTLSRTAFSCADIGFNFVTLSVEDVNGNSDDCTAVVSVEDNIAPAFVEPLPEDATFKCNLVERSVKLTATDNCDEKAGVTFTEKLMEGDCANSYTLLRTWTAEDKYGNSIVHEQNITVIDTTPPLFVALPDIVVQCADEIPDPDPSQIIATDQCGSVVTEFVSDETESTVCPKTITRTYRTTDECGNSADIVQHIYVNDTEAPAILCPPDLEITYDGELPDTLLTVTDFMANGGAILDNCELDENSFSISSNVVETNGDITLLSVTYGISDFCGNIATCQHQISALYTDVSEWARNSFRYTIFPNPNDGKFNFRIDSAPAGTVKLKLINLSGQVLETRSIEQVQINTLEKFDVSKFSKGIYYLIITFGDHQRSETILLE